MPITHKTRFFTSDMANAPVMTTGAGGIIAVLDGCLLNGFNTKTLSSLSVTSGIATATVSSGHGYSLHSVIDISGASISALNDTHRILSVPDANTFTFDATGVSNGTATGTITAIMSVPTGWTKAFSGTNKAAYKSTTSASGFYFRVDDSGAYNNANGQPARGYESMTDIDTGTAPFPTTAQQANFNWRRSTDASGDRLWALVADDQFFYLFVRIAAINTANTVMLFGDINSFDVLDAFACVCSGASNFSGGASGAPSISSNQPFAGSAPSSGLYIVRPHGAIAAGADSCFIAHIGGDTNNFSANATYNTATSSIAGGMLLARGGVIFDNSLGRKPHGMLPAFHTSLVIPTTLIPNNHSVQIINGALYLCTRLFTSGSAQDGFIAIGLDGWR
jgi:hypothetical protein